MPPTFLHHALKAGVSLQRYRIQRSLARGSFGLTYLAEDTSLHRPVVIKEYFPLELAIRDSDSTIQPASSEDEKNYQWGLQRFVSEARLLAKFNHRNIVRVVEIFEHNNTAYLVMTHEEGETLKDILERRKTLPEDELLTLLLPILDGLEHIHAKGFLHRDIKPANILIRPDGSPLLLDFGSAREALSQRTVTTLYSPGYAPIEQYAGPTGQQGPWTDIYGLGATLYCAAVGQVPVEALQRSNGLLQNKTDPYIPLRQQVGRQYSAAFVRAVDHALAFKTSERPQSIAKWRQEFANCDTQKSRTLDSATTVRESDHDDTESSSSWFRNYFLPILGSITVGTILGATLFHFLLREQDLAPSAVPAPNPQAALQTVSPTPLAVNVTPTPQADPYAEQLRLAELDIQAGRLTRPAEQNALDRYKRILAEQPQHRDAALARERLLEIIGNTVSDALNRGDLGEANALLHDVRNEVESTPRLAAVAGELKDREAQMLRMDEAAKQRQAEADRFALLEQIRNAIALGQYPKATELLQPLLSDTTTADPQVQGLQKELERRQTLAQLLGQAQTAMNQDRYDDAEQKLNAAARLAPKGKRVQALRRQLAERRGELPAEASTTTLTPPDTPSPPPPANEKQLERHIAAARAAMGRSAWDNAERELARAMAMAPDSLDVQILQEELSSRRAGHRPTDEGVVVPLRRPRTRPGPLLPGAPFITPDDNVADTTATNDGVVVPLRRAGSGRPPAESNALAAVAIRGASSSVTVARPGQTVVFTTQYSLDLPEGTKFDYVEVTWTLKRNGRNIGERGESSGSARRGPNQASTELTLPESIRPGRYVVEHRVQSSVGEAIATSSFTVAPN